MDLRMTMLTPRRLASWLASPLAYPSAQIARQTRCRVLLGPFAGMRYTFSFIPGNLFLGPFQVGSYEGELHSTVEAIVAASPGVLVNVGAGQGYYAVGFARRLPELAVLAFEADPAIGAAGERLARLNGVDDRIEARGACTPAGLADLDERLAEASVAVVMDCEGCEAQLADPGLAPWLARASWLVELHTSIDAEIEARLRDRFAATHKTSVVRARPPWASQWPEVMRLRGLRQIDRELLVAEFRHGGQDWLWAMPR
jgi:hypothetical protein